MFGEDFDGKDIKGFDSSVKAVDWMDHCIRCGQLLNGKGIAAHSEDELTHYVGMHCLKCLTSGSQDNH